MKYGVLYRLGFRPWEHYARVAAESIAVLLDREESGRSRPLGRALDLGCGRGVHTATLARRGWTAVGVDLVPRAVEEARRRDDAGASYVLGDVAHLEVLGLGSFDFFLDAGCFQGLDAEQRRGAGRGVTASARAGATLLMLAFQPTRLRALVEGVSREEVEAAFPTWEMLSIDPARTRGLGWPMNRTSPQWYRLRLSS